MILQVLKRICKIDHLSIVCLKSFSSEPKFPVNYRPFAISVISGQFGMNIHVKSVVSMEPTPSHARSNARAASKEVRALKNFEGHLFGCMGGKSA